MKTEKELLLTDLITEGTIRLDVEVTDWKQAIREAGQVLVDTGSIEPRYIDAMIRTAEELGPYIVIAPGVAFPHARPEEGSKRISMCFVTLKKPIEFGNEDNDPVKLVIAFSAVDNKSHIEVLAGLTNLLEKQEKVQAIIKAGSKNEILELVRAATEAG
jgi:mannitol operon transcriptional antiterminator